MNAEGHVSITKHKWNVRKLGGSTSMQITQFITIQEKRNPQSRNKFERTDMGSHPELYILVKIEKLNSRFKGFID